MSISNALFSPSYNKNEEKFNRLKTISNSINIYDIYNNENNPNKQYKEINSIYNYKNYRNINNIISSNTQSIDNIFNPKKIYDSPIKINFNLDNNNNDIKKNLNTIDYSSTKELRLERKISAKSIKSKNSYSPNKSSNVYKNNSLIFEPFSSKRILTIPTQGNHYGYAIDDNGETELLDDPKLLEKFNGTKNNSIGPGQYNIIHSPRRRLIIDWSKISEDRSINNNEKKMNSKFKEINELNKLDNLYLSTNIMNEKQNDSNDNYNSSLLMSNKNKNINSMDMNNFKNKIFKNNNIKLKDYKSDEDYINLTALNYIKQKNDEKTLMPGPGTYNYYDEFKIIPKKNKFQNFGSSVSRALVLKSPRKKKHNKIENYIKYSFFADKYIDDKKLNNKSFREKSKIYRSSKNYIEKVKIEELKDKNMKKKKEVLQNLGPGSYNPDINKIKRINKVENFGTLEKRKLTTGNLNTPNIISYIPLNDWTKKFNYKFRSLETESYGRKYKLNMVNKNKELNLKKEEEKKEINIEQSPYYKNNVDYKNKLINIRNKLKAGFGSREPRFHIFKSQINELNGVGKYNLFPIKKNKQQFAPFIYSSSRSNVVKKDNNKDVGPGTYNDYDTFYEWNKKTYNIKVKNKIDKFKN